MCNYKLRRGFISCVIILFSVTAYAGLPDYSPDYPHNSTVNAINCSSCHPENAPAGIADGLCGNCHTGTKATFEKTHSSLNTSDKYGTWSVDCVTCHDPHSQQQVRRYGKEGYLYLSSSTAVESGTEYSTIMRAGAGWIEHQWKEMLVIGNAASATPVFYKIYDNTQDTLTVRGQLGSEIASGDPFAIVYGALVKSTIDYTKTNTSPQVRISGQIKFFANLGENSFTEGTPTDGGVPTSGICVLCHTETLWQRNDGTGGGHYPGADCITCHRHEEGFRSPGYASGGTGSVSKDGKSGPGIASFVITAASTPPVSMKELNDPGAAYNSATKVCTGIYCHSNGTAAGVASASTPAWGQTFAGLGGDPCAKCHTNSPTGTSAHAAHTVGIHYNNIFTGNVGLAQPGTAPESSHGNATTSTTINCNVCHYNTVQKARNKSNTTCGGCHSSDAPTDQITRADLDKRYHVATGVPDVTFTPGGILSKAQLRDNITVVAELNSSWSRGNGYKAAISRDMSRRIPSYSNGSCSAVDCHNGNPASWTGGSISCNACHTALPQ